MTFLLQVNNVRLDVSALIANEPPSVSTPKTKKSKKVEEENKGMRVTLGKMHTKNKQLEINQQVSEHAMSPFPFFFF